MLYDERFLKVLSAKNDSIALAHITNNEQVQGHQRCLLNIYNSSFTTLNLHHLHFLSWFIQVSAAPVEVAFVGFLLLSAAPPHIRRQKHTS